MAEFGSTVVLTRPISTVAPDDPLLSVPEVVGTGILGVMLVSLLSWWRIRKAEDDDE